MLTHNQTVDLLKLIAQYYPEFKADSEKTVAWNEILKEFDFKMLKEAVISKVNEKYGYSGIKIFDLIHYCRNKLATQKVQRLNELNKIIFEDFNFLEKQLKSLSCDYFAKKNYLENPYYEKITFDFIKHYGDNFFEDLQKIWYNLSSSEMLKKFYQFAKFDIKHLPLREEIKKLNENEKN